MLYSKGLVDDVTEERRYSSKAAQQKAENDWLQTQVAKDAASYDKWQVNNGMLQMVLAMKPGPLHVASIGYESQQRDKGRKSIQHGGYFVHPPGSEGSYAEGALAEALASERKTKEEEAKNKKAKTKESGSPEYEVGEQWWKTVVEESGGAMVEESGGRKWWRKAIQKAMVEVGEEMVKAMEEVVEESGGSASDEDMVEVKKVDEESGGATSSTCYYRV